jgi:Arc/MetJ-type ribon-helix-helix transcriptional regulator
MVPVPYVGYPIEVKKTSVYLSEEEAEQLRALSQSTGRPQSELIREGIRSVLGRRPRRTFHSLGQGHGSGDPKPSWDAEELLRRKTGRG